MFPINISITLIGLILFELLVIIPPEKWELTIKEVRQGRFPANHGLLDMEKFLIQELLSPEPYDRPDNLADLIAGINHLMEIEKGRNVLNNWFI